MQCALSIVQPVQRILIDPRSIALAHSGRGADKATADAAAADASQLHNRYSTKLRNSCSAKEVATVSARVIEYGSWLHYSCKNAPLDVA